MCWLNISLRKQPFLLAPLRKGHFPRREVCVLATEVGSVSNDDGDGNENGKKARGLDWQHNNNFARASLYFVQLFAVAARVQRESA